MGFGGLGLGFRDLGLFRECASGGGWHLKTLGGSAIRAEGLKALAQARYRAA